MSNDLEHGIRRPATGLLLALALAAAPAARAAEDGAPTEYRQGWYVAPLLTYMKPDSARCATDSDWGYSLAFGNRGEIATLEAWAQFLELPHGECRYTVPDGDDMDSEREPFTEPAGKTELNGGGLAVLFGPYGSLPVLKRMYGVVGFGVLRAEGRPQYRQGDSTIFGDVGAGYLHPFRLWGLDFFARGDVRYRYDVQQPPYPTEEEQDPPPEHAFGDLVVNVGVQVLLSRREPELAPGESVAVVAPAVTDADGDGVPDEQDQCPDTVAGRTVDDRGCPPAAPAVTLETAQVGDTVVLHGVNFETASAILTMNARALLDQVADQLNARPALRIEVGGHTDSRGSDSYNQMLSEQRAQAVQAYLAERGVAAERLTAVGYGESQPVDSNDTTEGRERNRRVEMKVIE